MTAVLVGQVFGRIAALACRWLVWPSASSEAELIVMMMPFILSGVLPLSHRRTMAGATDYCLILLLQPSYPLTGQFTDSLAMTAAVVAAPLIALIGFRFVFPADARRRMTVLIGMMARELQDLARAPDAAKHRRLWQARLYHRLLRLARWSEKAGSSAPPPKPCPETCGSSGDPSGEHDVADFHRSFPTGRDCGRVPTTEVDPSQDAQNVGIACVAGWPSSDALSVIRRPAAGPCRP